jgi:hypothetical protein
MSDLYNVARVLLGVLDSGENIYRHSGEHALLRAALAQQVEKQQAEPVPPSGYAYRYYPDTIRFNDASKVDGVWPIESIPYWFGAHPTRQNKKDGKQ